MNAVAEGEWPERFYMEYWGEQSIIIFDFISIILYEVLAFSALNLFLLRFTLYILYISTSHPNGFSQPFGLIKTKVPPLFILN